MKLKSILAASLLAASATGAFANTVFTAPGSFSGMISDTFDFTILSPMYLTNAGVTAVLTPDVKSSVGFDITSVTWVGGPITFNNVDTPIGGSLFQQYTAVVVPTLLAAGTYSIKVTGTSMSAGSSYTGNVTLAPVPEPETYALMLAGLAAVGFIARRRS
nr:FxDxF family PEP-CTERM protein [uncultured Roseateles sp.]